MFILQQSFEHYQSKSDKSQRKLYVCFVNFKKAFDTVDCTVLWDVLCKMGVQGLILGCIKAMCACGSAAVKTKEGISAILRCYVGVKQGCPLSPDLFGIFTDELEDILKDLEGSDATVLPVRTPHKGVMLGRQISLLLYANDAGLVSTTRQGVQNQLSALHGICTARSWTVNVAKTKSWCWKSTQQKAASSAMTDRTLNK